MRVTARSKTVPPAGVIEQGVSWHRRTLEALLDNNLLVVVILVQTLLVLVIGRRLLDLDSWLTLMAGREIVQHGLPHHEVITTLPAGRNWVDQQWLAQLVFYGLHRLGGLGLAVVFHALMIGTALTITIVGARVRGASTRMTLLASSICLIVAPWSWQLRAQSIALPLFALTLALTSTDQALEAGRTTLVFPALVLWANIHGSVVIGAALVSTAGVLALARYLRARGRRGAPRPWRQLVFLAAPWACVLASPYGADLAGYYRLILFDSPVSRHITEWQAPRPHGYFLVFFAVAATTVAVVVWQRRRLSAYDIVALALTLAVALRSVRAVVWFSLAMALLLPLALDGLLRSGADPPVHRRVAATLIGATAAVLVATSIFVATRNDPWFERGWSSAAAYAADSAASTTDVKAAVWSSARNADWLLWKAPELRGRLAWDSRFELLTEPELSAIVDFGKHNPGWRDLVRGYPILVLDRRRDGFQVRALLKTTATRAIFEDHDTIVLARSAG